MLSSFAYPRPLSPSSDKLSFPCNAIDAGDGKVAQPATEHEGVRQGGPPLCSESQSRRHKDAGDDPTYDVETSGCMLSHWMWERDGEVAEEKKLGREHDVREARGK